MQIGTDASMTCLNMMPKMAHLSRVEESVDEQGSWQYLARLKKFLYWRKVCHVPTPTIKKPNTISDHEAVSDARSEDMYDNRWRQKHRKLLA